MNVPVTGTGYLARFVGRGRSVDLPVETWGDEGEPLVVLQGRLVDARKVSEYRELRTTARAAAILPGGDWVEEWCLRGEEGEPVGVWPVPVIAWVVNDRHEARAVVPRKGVFPRRDYRGQEIDWERGMVPVRTLRSPYRLRMEWREYRGAGVASRPWPQDL